MIFKRGINLQITKVANRLSDVLDKKVLGEKIDEKDSEDFVYFVSRAVSADKENGNGDLFKAAELESSYQSFIGKGLYLNHDSDKVEKAVGRIIDAVLVNKDPNDIHVLCFCKIDKKLYPQIARKVATGIIDSVSMGCTCEKSTCSICGREMHTEADFCEHMPSLGKEITVNGKKQKVVSINSGITFTELSLVDNPADVTAKIRQVYASADPAKRAEIRSIAEADGLKLDVNGNDIKRSVKEEEVKKDKITDETKPEIKKECAADHSCSNCKHFVDNVCNVSDKVIEAVGKEKFERWTKDSAIENQCTLFAAAKEASEEKRAAQEYKGFDITQDKLASVNRFTVSQHGQLEVLHTSETLDDAKAYVDMFSDVHKEESKKEDKVEKSASEYTDFTGKYMKDNPGSSMQDAAKAWKEQKGESSKDEPKADDKKEISSPEEKKDEKKDETKPESKEKEEEEHKDLLSTVKDIKEDVKELDKAVKKEDIPAVKEVVVDLKEDAKVLDKQVKEEVREEKKEEEPKKEEKPVEEKKEETKVDEKKDEIKKEEQGPKTDEERSMTHFKLSLEDWNKLTEDQKKDYISKLPPRGTGRIDQKYSATFVQDVNPRWLIIDKEAKKIVLRSYLKNLPKEAENKDFGSLLIKRIETEGVEKVSALLNKKVEKKAEDIPAKPAIEVPAGQKLIWDGVTKTWKLVPSSEPTTEVKTTAEYSEEGDPEKEEYDFTLEVYSDEDNHEEDYLSVGFEGMFADDSFTGTGSELVKYVRKEYPKFKQILIPEDWEIYDYLSDLFGKRGMDIISSFNRRAAKKEEKPVNDKLLADVIKSKEGEIGTEAKNVDVKADAVKKSNTEYPYGKGVEKGLEPDVQTWYDRGTTLPVIQSKLENEYKYSTEDAEKYIKKNLKEKKASLEKGASRDYKKYHITKSDAGKYVVSLKGEEKDLFSGDKYEDALAWIDETEKAPATAAVPVAEVRKPVEAPKEVKKEEVKVEDIKTPNIIVTESKKEASLDKKASAFDKVEKIDITDKLFAAKDKETGDIHIKDLEGKDVMTVPDAFGDDIVPIIKLFQEILVKTETPEKKKEIEEKMSALQLNLEATSKELIELKGSLELGKKVHRCQVIADEMVSKDLLELDKSFINQSLKKGMDPKAVREAAYKRAADKQVSELMKQDDSQIEAFAATVKGFVKTASQKTGSKLKSLFFANADLSKEGTISEELKSRWSRNR